MKKKISIAAVPSLILGIFATNAASQTTGTIGIADIMVGFVFFIIPFLLIFFILDKVRTALPTKNSRQASPIAKPTENITQETPVSSKIHNETNTVDTSNSVSSASTTEPSKIEHNYVAGVSFRTEEILSLGYENDEYNFSKKELAECYDLSEGEYEKIFKYAFDDCDAELEAEPDNEYDKNALKVVIDGVHVGYIKKGSCAHIEKLIANDEIQHITAQIHGGDYKILDYEYDFDKDKEIYTLKKEKAEFGIKLSIYLK